jgi:hypothetical protein
MYNHILSIVLFTPLVGAFVLLIVPKENKDAIRWIANIFALAGLLISLPLVPWFWALRFQPGFKFMEGASNNWIPSIGAGYVLGIDGISFLLIMLTTLLGWISILSSWTAIQDRVKEYYICSGVADRHARRLHGAGFLSVFRFLGSHAGSHVPSHRDLGRPAETLCGHQVFPLYPGGLGVDAAVCAVPLFLQLQANRHLHVQHPSAISDGAKDFPRSGIRIDIRHPALRGIFPGLCDQSTDCSRSIPGCPTLTWKRRLPVP